MQLKKKTNKEEDEEKGDKGGKKKKKKKKKKNERKNVARNRQSQTFLDIVFPKKQNIMTLSHKNEKIIFVVII